MRFYRVGALALVAFSAAVSCSLITKRSHQPLPERAPNSAATQEDLTFEEFRDLVLKADRPTIGDILERLATSHPGYMRHYVLSHDSLSLHGSSFKDPRAIVFGKTGRFIVSFNGKQDQRAYDKMEVMEFSKEHGHQFREIVFKSEPNSSNDLEEHEIDISSDDVIISKPNIGKCIGCHGTPARPIYQPYPLWPGMYGFDDDFLFHGEPASSRFQIKEPNTEKLGYEEYLRNRGGSDGKRHARYFHLRLIEGPKGGTYDNVFPQHPMDPLEPECDHRPNLCLNKLLADHMTQLLLKRVANGPEAANRLRFLAGLACLEQNFYEADTTYNGSESEMERQERRIRQQHVQAQDAWASRHFGRNLPEFRRRRDLYRSQHVQDMSEMLREDVTRVDLQLEGRLSLPGQDFSALSRRERVQRMVQYSSDSLSRGLQNGAPFMVAYISAGMGVWGFDLADYSIELRRQPVFQDGLGGFSTLGLRAREELQRATRSAHLPTCREVLRRR